MTFDARPRMLSSIQKTHLRYRDFAAIAAVMLLVIAFGVLRLDFWHLREPVYFVGDENLMLEYIKNSLKNGSISNDPQLAYPDGINLGSFPVFDTLSALILAFISIFTSHLIIGSNLLIYADHVISGTIGYICFRALRLPLASSIACAVAFAWIEFGLNSGRVIGHASLQLYAPLAIGATLALLPMARPDALWKWSTWGLALAAAGIVGLSQPYWVAFSLLAILPAGLGYAMTSRFRATALLAFCAVVMIVIAGTCILWPRIQDGSTIAIQRIPIEQVLYGLRLGDMLTPSRSHWSWLNSIRDRYIATRGDMNEGLDSFLGWPGLIGFAAALVILIRLPFRRSAQASVAALASLLIVILVAFSIRHGFGEIFNRIITPYIRAQNRVSPMIAFLAIFLFADGARRWGASLRTTAMRRAIAASVPLVVACGLWDQSFGINYAAVQADPETLGRWSRAKADAAAVSAALPPGTKILQLPFMRFPEGAPVGELGSYDEIDLALFTKDYKYSFGSSTVGLLSFSSTSPVKDALGAAVLGFDELLIYRRGYTNGIDTIVGPLVNHLHLDKNLDTPDVIGFDLRPLKDNLDPIDPVVARVSIDWEGRGFSGLEHDPHFTFRWDDSDDARGNIMIVNPSSKPMSMRLCGLVVPATPGAYPVTIDAAGQVTYLSGDLGGAKVDLTFDAPPGRSTISVAMPAPRLAALADPRHIHFQMRNPVLVPTVLLDSIKTIADWQNVPAEEACK